MSNTALLSGAASAVVKPRWLSLVTLCLAILVAQIDTAVVNLATRPIGEYFAAGVGELQWVIDSYNLVYAVLLLTGGLLADLYGRRRIFMSGAAVFTVASLLCAVAPSASFLIGARAFAGLGAALLIPASLGSSGSSGTIRMTVAALWASGRPATAWRWRSGPRSAAC